MRWGRSFRTLLLVFAVAVPAIGWAYGPAKCAWQIVPPGCDPGAVEVKFVEGSAVRLRDGKLASLAPEPARVDSVNDLLAAWPGARIERLCQLSEVAVDEWTRAVRRRANRPVFDLNLWYRIVLDATPDAARAANRLNALALVERAYPAPLAVEPPALEIAGTPDYTAQQTYRDAAPGGIDARFAWTRPGGRGAGVTLCDIEYSWNLDHEDAAPAAPLLIGPPPQDPFNNTHHGTAVLGELIGVDNGYGVTGLVPESTIRVAAAVTAGGYNPAAAVQAAAAQLGPGDVILLELQAAGPHYTGSGQTGCVPIEWIYSTYTAIYNAVAAGIVVVEAAGNGGEDLAHPDYGGAFDRALRDSGAIVVGAGAAPGSGAVDRSRLGFSCYGSRVDVQGWGGGVTTSGYGTLYNGGPNATYTGSFSGTSSASAMAAAAAAALQGCEQARSGVPLAPLRLRELLVETGSPQQDGAYPASQRIGPRPDLRAALLALDPPDTPTPTPTPALPDADGDGLPDAEEFRYPGADQTSWLLPDTDGDGLGDRDERFVWGTFPNGRDSDGDGLEDGIEALVLASDPLDAGDPAPYTDADGDGLPRTRDPDDTRIDTDGDRYSDGYEAAHGRDPADAGDVPRLGDVTGHDGLTNLDSLLLQGLFLNLVPLDSPFWDGDGFTRGDVNRDGAITNLDGLNIHSYFFGFQAVLPVE